MTDKEILQKYKEAFNKKGFLTIKSIQNINQHPHPYVIGDKHVSYVAKHHGGRLDKQTLEKVPCAHPKCQLPYSDHTKGDKVMFIQLKRDVKSSEMQKQMASIEQDIKQDNIDGFIFVETEEKFRIKE